MADAPLKPNRHPWVPGMSGTLSAMQQRFLGKFRGTVIDNDDPQKMNRVNVEVPEVPDARFT